MPNTALIALQKASTGLLYPSDSDEPFEAFAWGKANGNLTPALVQKFAGVGPKEAMKQIALGDFFKNLISDDCDDADKYKALLQVVTEQLSGVKVFRFGQVEVDVYLVGKTKEGEWAGLKTKAVET